ncbi:MAG: glutathione S-transferase [Pikeienuella sp.]
MKLYHSDASPYVRKVMVALHLAGARQEVTLVAGSGSVLEPNPETIAVNPLGKIPCLVTEEGLALYDSRVITRYLDARFDLGLYPDGDALWPVLAREALADGIMDAALLVVYEGRLRPETARLTGWVDGQLSKITRALDALEAEAGDWPAGFDASRIAVGCALGYLDLRHGGLGWRATRPELAAWDAQASEHPAFAATAPA